MAYAELPDLVTALNALVAATDDEPCALEFVYVARPTQDITRPPVAEAFLETQVNARGTDVKEFLLAQDEDPVAVNATVTGWKTPPSGTLTYFLVTHSAWFIDNLGRVMYLALGYRRYAP